MVNALSLTDDSIFSSYVGGDQARIMLQLAINAGYSMDQIRDLFEGPLRKAIFGAKVNQMTYFGMS